MQQVINAKDRNKAFFQFLGLFLVTVILVVGAVYFNYQMPGRINSMLRDEIGMQQSEAQYQQKFVSRMQEARTYLDSMGKSGVNGNLLDMQLTERMTELLNLQQKDSSLYGQMNKVIVETFLELQQTKKSLVGAGGNAEKISMLETELNKVKGELSMAQGQLDNFRKGPSH